MYALMSNNFESLKKTYKDIYQVTKAINNVLNKNKYDTCLLALKKREELITKANKLKINNDFSEEEKKVINEILDQIHVIEEKNMDMLIKDRIHTQDLLAKINQNGHFISAYKPANKVLSPRLVDSFE